MIKVKMKMITLISSKTIGTLNPQKLFALCVEGQKKDPSFIDDISEFGKWLKETEIEFAAEEKNSKNHLEGFDIVSLWNQLKLENQELKRQLAEKMAFFNQHLKENHYL